MYRLVKRCYIYGLLIVHVIETKPILMLLCASLRVFARLCMSLRVFARLCVSLRSLGVFVVFR